LHDYIAEVKVELPSEYLHAISDCIPDSMKWQATERPASSLLSKLLSPKNPVTTDNSTDSLLDETAFMLRRLEERRQQKKARLEAEESPKTSLPEWRLAEDWLPVELGAPIDFRHFL
jgi:hypothetical protein